MSNICKNCGREIRVMIFRGGDWCSDHCRKALLGKLRCSYEMIWVDEVGEIPVCTVHGFNSKYGEEFGEHRPCLAVEPWHESEVNILHE